MAAMILLLGLLLVTPATGQTADHRDIVAAAKAQVVNEMHIDPDTGPDECGRWEITRRAAAMLSREGAGLLDKQTGNQCRGFAVDIIAYPDGTIVDVLGRGNEGPSTPLWQINPNKVDPARWRPAPPLLTTAPPTSTERPPEPAPGPAPEPAPNVAALDAKLDSILFQLAQLRQQGELNGQKTEHVEQRLNEVVAGAKSLGVKMLPWLGMAAVGGACAAKD